MNKDPYYRLSCKASNGRFCSVSCLCIMLDLLQSNAAFVGGWMAPGSRDPGARKDIHPVVRAGPCTSTCSVLGRSLDLFIQFN